MCVWGGGGDVPRGSTGDFEKRQHEKIQILVHTFALDGWRYFPVYGGRLTGKYPYIYIYIYGGGRLTGKYPYMSIYGGRLTGGGGGGWVGGD